MRFATFVYSHPEGWFQSLGQALADHHAVEPVALHSSQLLADGTGVMLYELEGDADAVRNVLSQNSQTTEFQVTQLRNCVAAYIHYTPTETVERLLQLPEEYGLVIDTPMPLYEDGRLEVTVIGPQENISEAFAEIPDRLTTTVERVGTYTLEEQSFFDTLSERQREVLQIAYERGYYEEPRQVTHADIAADLNCSKGNVGEILRRIENNLVDRVFEQATNSESSPLRSW